MGVERIIIQLRRHGTIQLGPNGEKLNLLTRDSVRNLYNQGSGDLSPFIAEQGIEMTQAFLEHSDKGRTTQTGKAVYAGAFGLKVSDAEELERLEFPGLEVSSNPRLSYGDFKFNQELNAREGDELYMLRWMRNRDATSLEGVEVTPYSKIVQDGKAIWAQALERVTDQGKRLGNIVSHSGLVEPFLAAALESVPGTRIENLEALGGLFDMEDYANLTIERSRGGIYTAQIERKGQNYKVDFDRMRSKI